MITSSYVSGIQAALIEHGSVKYASEDEASFDVELLGEAIDENIPVDQASLASEGADVSSTARIAEALISMAEKTAEEKADIVGEFLSKLAAETVAGGSPGSVAPGESSARKTDMKRRLSNQVEDDEHRSTGFKSRPGSSSVKGGVVGHESSHSNKRQAVKEKIKALATQVADDAHRSTHHGAPGHQADSGKGRIGTEKAASLTDYLASL